MNYKAYLLLISLACALPVRAQTGDALLCSTLPMMQITQRLTEGTGLKAELLLSPNMGCPHDYSLTPADMRKLARAGILIINGLGMEMFTTPMLRAANPTIRIIDSSAGITNLIPYTEEEDHADQHAEHEHDHGEVNPHLFVSPVMRVQIAHSIARQLAELFPTQRARLTENAAVYAQEMNQLAQECRDTATGLTNRKIVTQHGAFDYLARDMGLKVVAVVQEHPGQDPSAAEMAHTIQIIRQSGAGGIFVEPQYPRQVGDVIGRETHLPVAALDPAASGPENAPPDYYETVMRSNLATLKTILGQP